MTGQEKGDLLITGDYLIEVTAWAGLTIQNSAGPLLIYFLSSDNMFNTTGATRGAWTAYPSVAPGFIPIFSGVCVAWYIFNFSELYFVDCCLSFFFWPFYCLFVFDLQLLITILVSSKFLRSKNKNRLSRNQDNVYPWTVISVRHHYTKSVLV